MNNNKPIKVFIHIPKTAGSTINSYLRRADPLGEDHVEAWINDDDAVRTKLSKLTWVSGHVPFHRMQARLSVNSSRPIQYHALLRDPYKQIMSHYNWLIEIYNRGEGFYGQHPLRIREISEEIRATDNSNPLCIIQQLERHANLFLNQQSRMVLNNNGSGNLDLISKLSCYQMISVEDHIAHFVHEISGLPYNAKIRKNTSNYHFDREVFGRGELAEFIGDRNSIDIELYKFVKRSNRVNFPEVNEKNIRRKLWFLR